MTGLFDGYKKMNTTYYEPLDVNSQITDSSVWILNSNSDVVSNGRIRNKRKQMQQHPIDMDVRIPSFEALLEDLL
ncbi:hypothetical protein Bhyg_11890 [Pseudolycoriella hygida]|uniref:Uncharacterized protein n=1 Tax=Pseudolycoriella hygida TaxID=35572 RepID=A0A9Q0RYS6_9DIPT|nr:hypothetical protein Bhyg_11890 [Pseudolycoriella hygida]